MNIYVGNLAYSMTEDELRAAFTEFGEVDSVHIIMDRYSGQSKGFGFVEMPDQASAEAAIKGLDGNTVKGRSLRVNQARPREERGRKKG